MGTTTRGILCNKGPKLAIPTSVKFITQQSHELQMANRPLLHEIVFIISSFLLLLLSFYTAKKKEEEDSVAKYTNTGMNCYYVSLFIFPCRERHALSAGPN